MTVCPATVTDPVRACAEVFAATVNVTDPDPVPDVRDSVTQDAPDEAVHAQPEPVVTVTPCVPPPLAIEADVGDAANVHEAAAAWVTVTVRPATVTDPVRDCAVVFAGTVSVTEPLPLPLAGVTAIHAAPELAVHAQPANVVTITVEVLPPFGIATVVGDTV